MFRSLLGGESQQKLLYVPNADTNPKEEHEISEAAIFRYLLDEETIQQLKENQVELPEMLNYLRSIDKLSTITEFETHRSSMGSVKDIGKAFHVFIVFKTTSKKNEDYWWSLEKNLKYIVLQRSRSKNDVKNKLNGTKRKRVIPIKENLKGKGSIRNLFAILWAHQVITEKYHIKKSNCQSLVTLVGKQITDIGYEYKGVFKFSLRENERDTEMLHLINLLTNEFDRQHPLFSLVIYENTNLFDTVMENGKYDIDDPFTPEGLTPLHLSIMLSKTKMARHLLNKWKASPTTSDKTGKNALHLAIEFANENMDIVNLLLKHEKVKIDELNEMTGCTALHLAVLTSNSIAVKHLLDEGANPNICDKIGRSPLHFAARYGKGTEIIDLILKAKNYKGIDYVDDVYGKTALHVAAMSSNEITAEYLIKNGANINFRANLGFTPLHMAAFFAEDMKIIDLLLTNIKEEDVDQYKNDDDILTSAKGNLNGLEEEINDRLREKGIFGKREDPVFSADQSDTTSITFNEKTENKNQSIDVVKIFQTTPEKLQDILCTNVSDEERFQLLLNKAILDSDVKTVRELIEKGTDISTVTWEGGINALHAASEYAKTTEFLDVILETEQFDINGGDNDGQTPLHYAMKGDNSTINVRLLIEKKADPNIAEEHGLTPLHFAVFYAKDMDIVELLLNHKDVDVNRLNKNGMSALDYAKDNKNGLGETIANRLKEKGAVDKIKEKTIDWVDLFEIFKEFQDRWGRDILEASKVESFLTDDKVTNENKIKKMLPKVLGAAIKKSDVEKVRNLIETEIDINKATLKENKEVNALHGASYYAKTTELIDAILETGKFDINGVDNDGNTPLYYAIIGDNSAVNARHLILKGADPNIANADGRTAFHLALVKNNVNVVRHLLKRGADPTKRDNNGNTPFQLAAMAASETKDTYILDLLLANENVKINERNENGMTALHMAVMISNVTTIRYLIEKGANPNIADEDGWTPLHLAAIFAKDMDIVEFLLSHKDVDVNRLNNKGENALDYAKDNVHGLGETIANRLKEKGAVENEKHNEPTKRDKNCVDEIIKMLKELAVSRNQLRSIEGQTEALWNNHVSYNKIIENPLKIALEEIINNSDVKKLRELIETGVDISKAKWEEGQNALHAASKCAKTTVLIDVMLETEKFDINGEDNNGNIPLHYAIKGGNPTINARHLIEKGANPTVRGINGTTSLQFAAISNKVTDILDLLLANEKVDINEWDENGLTALHLAIANLNVTTVRYLIEKGANPSIAEENGWTTIHLAAKFANDMEIVELILNHKDVDVNYLDNKGRSALLFAKDNEHGLGETIANRLKEKGAVDTEVEMFEIYVHNKSRERARQIKVSTNDSQIKTERDEVDCMASEALHDAIINSDVEMVRIVLETGLDFSKPKWEEKGINALHLASQYAKTTELIEVILENGQFNLNGKDTDGQTPLHYAIKGANPSINARHLIEEKGADPNISDKNGVTPLQLAAAEAKTMDLIDLLLNIKVVDLNHCDNQGRNAFVHGLLNENGLRDSIISRLRERGAKEFQL